MRMGKGVRWSVRSSVIDAQHHTTTCIASVAAVDCLESRVKSLSSVTKRGDVTVVSRFEASGEIVKLGLSEGISGSVQTIFSQDIGLVYGEYTGRFHTVSA
jgi:hypothetical protein